MKYITLPGIAITRVGDKPRHSDRVPSFLAIFRKPSNVELKDFCREASAAQLAADVSAAVEEDVAIEGFNAVNVVGKEFEELATQNGDVLVTQKTSRQQAVTPRLEGRFLKAGESFKGSEYDFGEFCDWRRTRTTSRGVTCEIMLAT